VLLGWLATACFLQASVVRQTASDFGKGQFDNTTLVKSGLRLGDDTTPATFESGYKLFGLYTSQPESAAAFDALRINYRATLPAHSEIVFAFRTLSESGAWSVWREVSASERTKSFAVLRAVSWQYRVTIYANDVDKSPTVHSVSIQTTPSKSVSTENSTRTAADVAALAATHPTYRIYATREGLVGHRTANGHTITSRDHFVALPSGTVLDCNGCSTYTVTVNYPVTGRTVTERVYDVGPWNTRDNYWHNPRAEFASLDIGLPEAQAAYQNGFNGGKDESGRTVLNPAGIDLADGTFWDSLGMSGNDWVNVTFNWEALPGTSYIVDNSDPGFTASANWSTGTSSANKFGANYRFRSTAAISDAATWSVSLAQSGNYAVYVWYPNGSNRSQTAPYIVNHNGVATTKSVNQQINGGQWNLLGTWFMNAGVNTVKLSCWTTAGFVVVADAVKWQQQ
jgi:hypothetical protein